MLGKKRKKGIEIEVKKQSTNDVIGMNGEQIEYNSCNIGSSLLRIVRKYDSDKRITYCTVELNQSFIGAPKVGKISEQKQSFPEPPAQVLKSRVQGVEIIFTSDSAEMKLEPLRKITNVVKVFDERLKTTSDDFQAMEYSNKICHQ
ncbi:hypothetical protein V6N11_060326 [Hibiscus sabdariffa]|uniref:Uncharacterized protein n=1 Tax=Hibiscus sabdariffa TaxID=183260 RepID=A0ABR2QPZ4_9ROSI